MEARGMPGGRVARRLVVVGGDAAGMTAASQARRRHGPEELQITVFEAGSFTSYSACGIPYYIGTVVEDLQRLIVRTPEVFRRDYAIDARIRHEVVEIDRDRSAVRVRRTEDGKTAWEPYDELLIATGAVPLRPSLPGADAQGIFGVQTLEHGIAIKKAVDEGKPRCAVVVGGGYIGLEMAEAFKARHVDVVLVEKAPQVMSSLDADMGALVAEAVRDFGISVRTGEGVTGFETSGGRVRAVVTERETLPADIVVMGLGVSPNTALAEAADIPIGSAGGVRVDGSMRTPVDNVWAAGDCAEKWHRIMRRWQTIPLGTHANKEGRVAGTNITGGRACFPGVLGTAVTKVCEVEVARTGLSEEGARQAGYDHLSVVVDSTTRAGYFPGSTPIKTKMIVERRSGLLLGAQIVGREGAAKRIDVVATALWNEMSVDDLFNVDLSYAPPFSPVWDPILITARTAWLRVEEDATASA